MQSLQCIKSSFLLIEFNVEEMIMIILKNVF